MHRGAWSKCHLGLVHGGTLRVVGDAGVGGVLKWEAIGFAVRGRQRVGVVGVVGGVGGDGGVGCGG